MSTDESTIAFPVNMLKAETLRSMAKDLGVIPGGKKDELVQRLRAISASGWVTPTKRKSDPETFESPPPTTKKSRPPRTPTKSSLTAVVELSSPPRRHGRRSRGTAVAKVSPRKKQHEHPGGDNASNKEVVPNGENPHEQTKPSPFDDYLTSGPTSVFITGDDLLTMVEQVPAPAALTLWKVASHPTERDASLLTSVDHWLIPANEVDKIQNVAAFKEAYHDVIEKLRELKAATHVRNKTPQGTGKKGDATALNELTKRWWYEVSVSRNLGNGALAVKLIRGTVEGNGVVSIKDAKEEDGTFWLSKPIAAKQDDSELLDRSVS